MENITVKRLIELLAQVDPEARVYLMDTGIPKPLFAAGVGIVEEPALDADGAIVQEGSVVLV